MEGSPIPPSSSPWHALPAEVIDELLSFLPAVDLVKVAAVSRDLRRDANVPHLWRRHLRQLFVRSGINAKAIEVAMRVVADLQLRDISCGLDVRRPASEVGTFQHFQKNAQQVTSSGPLCAPPEEQECGDTDLTTAPSSTDSEFHPRCWLHCVYARFANWRGRCRDLADLLSTLGTTDLDNPDRIFLWAASKGLPRTASFWRPRVNDFWWIKRGFLEAAENGKTSVVRSILEASTADERDKLLRATSHHFERWTALHWAYHHGYKHLIKLLLSFNAPSDITDHQGRTPSRVLRRKTAFRRLERISNSLPEEHPGLPEPILDDELSDEEEYDFDAELDYVD